VAVKERISRKLPSGTREGYHILVEDIATLNSVLQTFPTTTRKFDFSIFMRRRKTFIASIKIDVK
jgi:hypothetical protein